MALSTLRPATSPRLSAIHLRLSYLPAPLTAPPAEALIASLGEDLRRVADEFSRIKREFEGAVKLTVSRDPAFKDVLDTLNVSLCFCGVDHALRS